MVQILIYALFLLSGFTALVYQVVWTKLLTLVFGVTLVAVSTVLTSFFGGLALGSYLGGKWADKKTGGLLWYGIAEAIIGAYALIFSMLLNINNSIYASIAPSLQTGFAGLTIVKFLFASAILIIPTTLMGATLPILSKTLAKGEYGFARRIGLLYAINTAGAIAGAVISAFVLIPSLGLQTILYTTGALNIAIGLTSVYLSRFKGKSPENAADKAIPDTQNSAAAEGTVALPPHFSRLLIIGFAVSGFTGLAYEVIWTRVLGFMLTGTVYAFAAVLAVFLTGIALGSAIFSAFTDKIRTNARLIAIFATIEILIGLSSIALISLYDRLPDMRLFENVHSTIWGEFIYLHFLAAFLTLIIPTFLFGATFPLVCKLYDSGVKKTGERIGNIYSVNTVGGILGSFAGGFVLIPAIGMQNTIIAIGLVNVLLGLVFIIFAPGRFNPGRGAAIAAAAIATAVVVAIIPDNMPLSLHKKFISSGEDVVFYKEDPSATVMITERKGADLNTSNKRLWINGNRATAAYYEGLQINRFQGVLPMVLHPDPKDVLVICFGSGTTFGTLSRFPVSQVDNVEIAPTVIKGAPYFKWENRDVLNNPKSRIIIDDGRSYLAAATKKYDVITEEPMHPALAGVVNLYTKEYYELAKAHLKDGGMMSQWIPLYNLSTEDVREMVKTFQTVFPHTTIWLANTDIFMIGSKDKLTVDYLRLIERTSAEDIKSLLTEIDLDDRFDFMNTFLMSEDRVRQYTAGAGILTDDRPTVEFTGPRSLNVNTISPNLIEFLKYREPIMPHLKLPYDVKPETIVAGLRPKFNAGQMNIIGRAHYANQDYSKANEYFQAALDKDPTEKNSLHYVKVLRFYR